MTAPVTLDTCDQEPIHIPGAVQPHGVLLALHGSNLRVLHASDNVEDVLGVEPKRVLGASLEQLLDPTSAALIRANAALRSWKRLNPISAEANGRRFDVIVHRSSDLLIVELEPVARVQQGTYRDYGADTHQAMVRLQGAESLPELMQMAAEAVRWVTGYDRVMVYRFSEEGHGEVVAEDRLQSLESFLGLHYPASDIPAQARRLYTLNWLRVIVDIGYRPAALLAAPELAGSVVKPLDLTYSTLRSVSPIHIEYLRNMGVGASMSVSLIQDGKLWGLIACHHYAPKFIAYSARMTCELLGQMLSTLLGSMQKKDDAATRERVADRQVRLQSRLSRAHYVAAALAESPSDLLELVGATGAAILEEGRFTGVGACPPEASVRAFAAWVAAEGREWVTSSRLAVDFPTAPSLGSEAAGVLGFGVQPLDGNLLLWCRNAVEKTVSWAGNPEKTYAVGPNGPRLSPRGSFALWQETVRNQSESWSQVHLDAARELRAGVGDATVRKAREADQMRDMLLGMVSHDLRNPLGAISLAAQLLQTTEPEKARVTRTSARIAASSDRMRRMIEQLLDYTRSQSGALRYKPEEIDLVLLCQQLAEEVEGAHPGSRIETSFPEQCLFHCDPDRIAQVISNLLGNARHHGDPAHPIRFTLRCSDDEVEIEVRNQGPVIPADRLAGIFEPFKRSRESTHAAKHSGLGLGLFIVKSIVEMHQGRIDLRSTADDGTACTITLPRIERAASSPG